MESKYCYVYGRLSIDTGIDGIYPPLQIPGVFRLIHYINVPGILQLKALFESPQYLIRVLAPALSANGAYYSARRISPIWTVFDYVRNSGQLSLHDSYGIYQIISSQGIPEGLTLTNRFYYLHNLDQLAGALEEVSAHKV